MGNSFWLYVFRAANAQFQLNKTYLVKIFIVYTFVCVFLNNGSEMFTPKCKARTINLPSEDCFHFQKPVLVLFKNIYGLLLVSHILNNLNIAIY